MKVLFDYSLPFSLAHGGFQVQVEHTVAALREVGVEVEHVRWWDASQKGDLIHYLTTPSLDYVRRAQDASIRIIATPILSEPCNRPLWKLRSQGMLRKILLAIPFGASIKEQLSWQVYSACSRLIVGLNAEKEVLVRAFNVQSNLIRVVPLGLDRLFLKAESGRRSQDNLICIGTITAVKGSVELAELAHRAQVPILFVGKPYSETDSYWKRFQALTDNHFVKYRSHVTDPADMVKLIQEARGFALFSRFENWSLAASEAVACGLPLLLPNQPWAHERFGETVRYFETPGSPRNVEILRDFFRDSRTLPAPGIRLYSWSEVAERLRDVYAEALA